MKLISLVAVASAIAAPAAASAATITFDALAHDGNSACCGSTLDIDGYRFSSHSLYVLEKNSPANADPGGATLSDSFGHTTTVTAIDGSTFDLTSLDLADGFNVGWSTDVVFTFTDAVGTTTETITIDKMKGLQTFVFNKTDLLSFSYGVDAEKTVWTQIDNIVLNSGNTVPGVPEPSTWAMLISGFGLVGAAARRRKVAPAIA